MNILLKANEFINAENSVKSEYYGDFNESMKKTATIFNLLSNSNITAKEVYLLLISLKLARESFKHKEDNLLDLVAYASGLNDYLEI